ncbi:MAG: hypothetical protein EOP56_14415 [Sphingobacteriales bacterium]|nr:MAG: hypothetical protein EOP56_14415 [Sphingobacteriales bacterium]
MYKKAVHTVSIVKKHLDPPKATTYNFHQKLKRFAHMSRPWQTYDSKIVGAFSLLPGASTLCISDSIIGRSRNYPGATYYTNTIIARKDYGSKDWDKATTANHKEFFQTSLLYSPLYALNDFLQQGPAQFKRLARGNDIDTIIYNRSSTEQVSILINKKNKEVLAVAILHAHELYGDNLKLFTYKGYTSGMSAVYPTAIQAIEHDTVTSDIHIRESQAILSAEYIIGTLPANYALQAVEAKSTPEIIHTKYNDHVHFFELPHTDERLLVVDFKDFLVVAEAPLNTANGELIIKKAGELFPGKPVRYFMFGHHHPHYLGGIRAFIHNGTTILSRPEDTSYIRQLASFPHTITPDILALEPRALKMEVLDAERTITDGTKTMRIIHIGDMSQHTDDYLVYYFPEYRLLFQDDLGGIYKDKPIQPASGRQKGLYDAIKKYGLTVDIIVQGWPIKSYGYKTIFPFGDLEESVKAMSQK